MAFTNSLATDIGKVRLILRDADQAKAAFTDADIQVFIDLGGSVDAAVGRAASALLMERARFGMSVGENVSVDAAMVAYLERLVTIYGASAPTVPAATVTTFARGTSDPSRLG